jgi:hypothetical protein
METWLKSALISAIASTPLLYLTIVASASSIAGPEIPKTAQSALNSYAQLANDMVYELKVQAGIAPDPANSVQPI